MAEVAGLRNNALPYPCYGVPFGIVFPMLDADGDLVTGATTPDAEVSLNGDTFAECTNESTEIATASGVYYLLLTAAEMTADVVTVIAKSATAGMKTTVLTLYPRKLVTLASGTAQGSNDTGDIQLAAGSTAVDDFFNGCLVVATIDSVVEARMINDYVGSTLVAEVSPAFSTAQPDSNDTYVIYLPEGRQFSSGDLRSVAGVTNSVTAAQLGVNVVNAAGTAWASGSLTSGVFASGAITATAIATDAIGAAELADGAITAATFAAGAIDATAVANGAIDAATFAAGAIDAAALAADASTEINAAVLAILGTPAGASMSADIAAIEAQTDDIGAAGAGLTALATQVSVDGITAAVITNAAGTDIAADIIAVKAETASILDDTDDIGVAGAGLTAINLPNQTMDIIGNITGNLSGSVGSVTGAVGSVTGAVGSVTGAVGSVTGAVGSIGAGGIAAASFAAGAIDASAIAADAIGSSELAASAVDEILDDPLTDSIPADGALPTVRQALYMLTQFMLERSVSGTTLTVNKVDGTTALFTLTLNDGTTPTAITRAT